MNNKDKTQWGLWIPLLAVIFLTTALIFFAGFKAGQASRTAPATPPPTDNGFFSPPFFFAAIGTPCLTITAYNKFDIHNMSGDGSQPDGDWHCTIPTSTDTESEQVTYPNCIAQTDENNVRTGWYWCSEKTDEGSAEGLTQEPKYWIPQGPQVAPTSTEWSCQFPITGFIFTGNPTRTHPILESILTTIGTSTPESEGYSDCTQLK